MPENVPGAEGAQHAGSGLRAAMTRKVGPLPIWAYAVLAGAAVLAVRLYMGGGHLGGSKSGSAAGDASSTGSGPGTTSPSSSSTSGSASLTPVPSPVEAIAVPAARIIEASPIALPKTRAAPSYSNPPPGFAEGVVNLKPGLNNPSAPIIRGVDWSPAAVTGYFTKPAGDEWERFGLSRTPTGAAPVFEPNPAGGGFRFALPQGGYGNVSPTQRFIGYVPGTNTPIFQ